MKPNPRLSVFALLGICVGAVHADSVHADSVRADPVTMQAQCSIDSAKASVCEIKDEVASDGSHHMEFVVGDKRLHFVGKSQTGWWSGELDGKPAMGYERNRGYVVFSTTDLESTFEWWTKGAEHGSY